MRSLDAMYFGTVHLKLPSVSVIMLCLQRLINSQSSVFDCKVVRCGIVLETTSRSLMACGYHLPVYAYLDREGLAEHEPGTPMSDLLVVLFLLELRKFWVLERSKLTTQRVITKCCWSCYHRNAPLKM